MRYFIINAMIVLFVSCETTKISGKSKNDNIVYILPNTVTQMLEEKIINDHSNVYFCLYSDSGKYSIYSDYIFMDARINAYAKKTNRKLFINGKFYPLIFKSDMLFASTEGPNEVLRKYVSGDSVLGKREYTIHDGFYITFKQDGTIEDSGGVYINDKGGPRYINIKRN
jgi:hypothetical protein